MRFGALGLRWLFKVLVIWAAIAPIFGWSQVLARPRAFAGVDAAGSPATVEASLRAMAAQADVIFYGTVVSIRRESGEGFAAGQGVVEVTFAVTRGVRGATDGGSYVLREWGGLWAAGAERYHVGSRLLMLLHAPGGSGLSSPVGGVEGAIPVHGSGTRAGEIGDHQASATEVVDLRWVAAKLARPVVYAKKASATATGSLVDGPVARPVSVSSTGAQGRVLGMARAEATAPQASAPAEQASVETVLAVVGAQAREVSDAR